MVGQGMIYNVISFSVVLMLIYLVVQRDYYLLMGEGICVFIQWFIKEVTEGWYPPIFNVQMEPQIVIYLTWVVL